MRVKEFATVVSGATPSSTHPEYYDGNIVWFTPKDLSDQNTKYISEGERKITKEGYNSCSAKMLPAGSVLMSSRAPIGLLAITRTECCTNQGFKNFVVNKELCNPEFLYYYLKHHIREVEALGSGTTFKEVSKDSIENYDVKLPEMEVQDSVAEVLALIDAKIENNNDICAELEAMAKLLYDYWFVQFDFPDETGKPYKSSGGKMIWSEELKREIPEGWTSKRIGDISQIVTNSITPNESSMYHHFSIPAFDEMRMPVYELGSGIDSNKYLVKNDCILVSKLNPQFKRIWFVSQAPENSICSTEFMPFVSTNNTMEFLYSTLNSDAFYTFMVNSSSSSTGSRKRMDPELCPQFQIPYPKNGQAVERYCYTIKPTLERINILITENQALASLRDFLLPLLMNGQVSFKEVDTN